MPMDVSRSESVSNHLRNIKQLELLLFNGVSSHGAIEDHLAIPGTIGTIVL